MKPELIELCPTPIAPTGWVLSERGVNPSRAADRSTGRIRDAVISISLANLCLISRWHAFNRWRTDLRHYLAAGIPPREDLAALLLSVLVLGLIFFGGARLVRAVRHPLLTRMAQAGLIGAFYFPARAGIRWAENRLPFGADVVLQGAAAVAWLACVVWVWFPGGRRLVRTAVSATVLMAPLLPISICYAVHQSRFPESAYRSLPLAPPLPAPGGPRVVWLLFDELDETLAFDGRPTGLSLPEFDSLRSTSVVVENAHSPATQTAVAVPALLAGASVAEATALGPGQLRLRFPDGSTSDWGKPPSLFSRVRAMGRNAGLAGWYHPYCRVMGEPLAECYWSPAQEPPVYAWDKTLTGRVVRHLVGAFRSVPALSGFVPAPLVVNEPRHIAAESYRKLVWHAMRMAARADLGLVFIHLPVPHPPAMWDRRHHQFRDQGGDYFDNLELADRALQCVRDAIEAAGLGATTILLVTADHGFRPRLWKGDPQAWSREVAARASRLDNRVPFLLRFPTQRSPLFYPQPISNLVAHDLTLALLANRVTTPAAALAWLDANRTRFPVLNPRMDNPSHDSSK